jgi:hypothetical protein
MRGYLWFFWGRISCRTKELMVEEEEDADS